ncbi:neutral zinc metallopeptidase [Actinopolyspora saharensis]|uniref:Putative neutral zinc metallopeptidase n=1 Tax=Actinopolyspora saharensis TaxID=995062 RepID=A0A1H1DT99_9ACTN|nr:neutral zinc metallopeptidase [Actinopolyspora saharensis]SDQ79633.1 Putative neutral zinc metallopeptidase [Actinopolyspora saharensis]
MARSSTTRRLIAASSAALALCLGVTGCSRTINGTPTTNSSTSADTVAGLPASDGPSGLKPAAQDADLPVEGGTSGKTDTLATNAVADVQQYWRSAYPETFGDGKFRPIERLVSYDSTSGGRRVCGQDTAGLANAFYCPAEDTIAWDRGELLPGLRNTFGAMAPVTVLAHEFGHAVQHRAGLVDERTPTLVSEQQADCFTGAFFRHAAEGSAEHIRVSTGSGLNKVLGVLGYIRDEPGRTGFSDARAHGSAFDRVSAFQYGFSDGPKRCAEMTEESVTERTTQFRFWKQAQETDLPVDEQSIAQVERSLREVFGDTGVVPPELTTEQRPCHDEKSTEPASYCATSNTISLNLSALRDIAAPPDSGDRGTGYGDFAAYAQLASRYALAVQEAAGLEVTGDAAGLRTACLVGAWSGLIVEDPIGRRNPVGRLRIAPGDLDEGIASLLSDDGLIAADARGEQVPAGFARVEAFRIGFQQGMTPCSSEYDA